MTLYQQSAPTKTRPPIVPPMIPMQNPFYPYPNPYYPYSQAPYQPYVMKNYNISMSNPSGNHANMSALYEDILPGKNFYQTSNTLEERFEMFRFIRNVLIKTGDGEDISLDAAAKDSLLHRIKLIDVNPYASSPFYNNPYKDLPYGFLLYNSCYPIRYDNATGRISCSKNSVGMNVRIYRLSLEEYNVNRLQNKFFVDYDVWREIAYYEFIREDILKKKLCPNFVLMYSWYMDEHCEIDFDKLESLTNNRKVQKTTDTTKKPDFLDYLNQLNQKDTIIPLVLPSQEGGQPPTMTTNNQTNPYSQIRMIGEISDNVTINTLRDQGVGVDVDFSQYSKKAVVSLTEAPNTNFYGWASQIYEADGIRRIMVSTGFYADNIWMSVLFQLMVALYTMQIKKIFIRNFSLEDNVYIKDLYTTGQMNGYWLYKIDNIEYYIPNYGYLVLIDSKFKDVETPVLIKDTNKKRRSFKIEGTVFKTSETANGGGEIFKDDYYHKQCFEIFRKCFNSSKFEAKEKNKGFVKPSDKVMELINKISLDTGTDHTDPKDLINSKVNKSTIGYYIHKYMRKFLNNRVGTLIQTDELDDMRSNRDMNFRKGEMIQYEMSSDSRKWGVYIGPNLDPNKQNTSLIYTKENPSSDEIISYVMPTPSLRRYSDYKSVKQNYKIDASKLAIDNKLETYVLEF